MNSVQIDTLKIGTNGHAFTRPAAHVPGDLENRVLRQAVQENLVSFPAQVPVFERQSRADLQQKIVVLYFLRGWTMDDIAKRYGLGRQRMGQILTAWRTRAVKEGYVQAIEPEHPVFKRVRLEQANQFAEVPVRPASVRPRSEASASALRLTPIAPTPETDEPRPAMPTVAELRGSNLAEELHAIVGVLDNQLRVCSRPVNGNIDSCEQLLARARMLCARLEANVAATRGNDEWRATAVIAAAKELFQRFQEYALERSASRSKPALGQAGKGNAVKPFRSITNSRNVPPRASQRAALEL
jgi:hypothetical protein